MTKYFTGFALAFSMLSIIPFFKVHNFYKGINSYAVLSYPLVGFILGYILYLVYFFLHPYIPSVHMGIIIFVFWVLITGALHLDGFSDTLDGLFVAKERSLEVMKDPHAGGMGMIFSVTFLMFKASSVIYLELYYLLPLIMMLSRFNAVIAIYMFEYVSPKGMSTLAKEEFTKAHFVLASIYVFIFVLAFHALPLLLASILTLYLLKLFFIKRYGGFTGDIYGFAIEVTELILLNLVIISL